MIEPITCPGCGSKHTALPGPNVGSCKHPWHDQNNRTTKNDLRAFAEGWRKAKPFAGILA